MHRLGWHSGWLAYLQVDEEGSDTELEQEEANFVLEAARAQCNMCILEQQLAAAKVDEMIALGNLYRFRAQTAEHKLEDTNIDVGCICCREGILPTRYFLLFLCFYLTVLCLHFTLLYFYLVFGRILAYVSQPSHLLYIVLTGRNNNYSHYRRETEIRARGDSENYFSTIR
ncbi:hypothetical protein PISMIDRAFT_656365 [Pisolithus microcarpus 441]|uniref:Uncharacterized protein n=1 Tax=Pisolithus microcarpus 441 TaxID=765257 RepID=A0A0C9Y7H8_9AGAM|nr:hypothetical protein BKA83DRAFT_656365 [Pisolithus microcarpus]KIK20640.1 hypothetical protein PISMIDRAFT_656365 [Pisolithus microcarpus 441]